MSALARGRVFPAATRHGAPSSQLQIDGLFGARCSCAAWSATESSRFRSPIRAVSPRFYLAVAAGGALGGAFVGLVAPHLFDDFYELHWGFFRARCSPCSRCSPRPARRSSARKPVWAWLRAGSRRQCVARRRSAAALARQSLTFTVALDARLLRRAQAVRGAERGPARQGPPARTLAASSTASSGSSPPTGSSVKTSYYGVGRESRTRSHCSRRAGRFASACVGLRSERSRAWGQAGDRFAFYEINPNVRADRARKLHLPARQLAREVGDRSVGDARLSARGGARSALRSARARRVQRRLAADPPDDGARRSRSTAGTSAPDGRARGEHLEQALRLRARRSAPDRQATGACARSGLA